jgi:signal transduction histidine kinase/CheY-like chemotaxis protein
VLDQDYRFLAINRANADEYERVYGIRPRVGDSLLDLLADRPLLRAAARAVWSRALSGEAFIETAEFGDPEIQLRWYEMKFGPLFAPGGKRLGAYQFSSDVSIRLREQARLAEAEEQLRQSQKMEAIGQLTGGIAHDFNNLLASISGSFEVLDKRLELGTFAGSERFIAAGRRATRRAAALIQRLLAFSRRQNLDPRPTNVNRLISGMEDLVRRSVGPQITVEVVSAEDLWATRIDASQLENALLNLCINARDAMAPEGGRLTIETANKPLDEASARACELPPGEYVWIGVTDTGCGMPAEVIARAFDPFFTTKPFGEGTGLGLSMVYGFARQSGGQVKICSEVGEGSTLCLYLPRYVGEVVDTEPEAREAVNRGTGEIVLVIDDEPSIRMLIMEVLKDHGYAGIEAGDGPTGLRLLQSDARIDLLITDLGLPGGMGGHEVAAEARRSRPDLKVLFITGFAENVFDDSELPAGTAVMTKPFVMSALGNRVRDLLDRS